MAERTVKTTTVHDYGPATETMRDDVLRGLSQDPKMLPSQYLYDKGGAPVPDRFPEAVAFRH
jgi:uncharacterized SAM-dependent methyltransferase